MKHSELSSCLKVLYQESMSKAQGEFCQGLMILSEPGMGKSQAIKEFAESKGVKLHVINAITDERSDTVGMKMPNHDTGMCQYFDPQKIYEVKEGDIILFEEFLEAPQHVLNAYLDMIGNRRLPSGYMLPSCFIVAASNPVVQPQHLRAALRQRFRTVYLTLDNKELSEYLAKQDIFISDADLQHLFENTVQEMWNLMTPRSLENDIKLCKANLDAIVLIEEVYRHQPVVVDTIKNASDMTQLIRLRAVESLVLDKLGIVLGEHATLSALSQSITAHPETDKIRDCLRKYSWDGEGTELKGVEPDVPAEN